MRLSSLITVSISILLSACLLSACQGDETAGPVQAAPASKVVGVSLDVYKSESCGCCTIWTQYMEKFGYTIAVHHPADLNAVKERYGIAPQWQSCHTAVTADGHFFEGHVPERYVRQFMQSPPENATGLAVPGMPLGSPGMEVDDRFKAYDIYVIMNDGSAKPYVRINSAADQY